jgi:hypothetical protein
MLFMKMRRMRMGATLQEVYELNVPHVLDD